MAIDWTSIGSESPLALLAARGQSATRAYEDAASAIGRLDATGTLASGGMRELLLLRCATAPFGSMREAMIALFRPARDGSPTDARLQLQALRLGASRARGGVIPSVALIHELLAAEALDGSETAAIDALLRDRTPPVLKAAMVAGALQSLPVRGARREARSALAVTLVLCVGGALTDAWLTLRVPQGSPLAARAGGADANWGEWLAAACVALAREALLAERGLAAARERAATDEERVRTTLGRASFSALDLLALLRAELAVTVPDAARVLGITAPTAGAAVARLERMGIAHEITGHARSRTFVYLRLIEALSAEGAGEARASVT